jgi:hypothetical protein
MDFVVVAEHTPDDCPSANKKIRDQMTEGFPHLPDLAKKQGVEISFVGIPMVSHKIFMVGKAPNYESIRNVLVQGGLLQSNTLNIYPTISFEEAMKQVNQLQPIF